MATAIKHNNDDTASRVMVLLELVRDDAVNSTTMYDLGVSTTLAAKLEKLVLDPLNAMMDSYGSLFKSIHKFIKDILLEYFTKNKDLIRSVYDASEERELVYYVVLKEDTFKNRELFFDFLSQYDDLGFQSKIPLTIKFLPERVIKNTDLQNEMSLN